MNSQEKIIQLLLQKKEDEAVDVFKQTPIFDYSSKQPLIKYEHFEFSKTQDKNPIFLRILINYISLINLVNDQKIENFQDILLKFCAKLCYLKQSNGSFKLILMAKSSLEVYNICFQKGKEIFKNVELNLTDVAWNEDKLNTVGYTFQELAIIFVNDYIIGREKGTELPNILFYIYSTEETQLLLNKIKAPKEVKLDLNEEVDKSGVTEFDYIIKMNQELKINCSNPYFRYIKKVFTEKKNCPVEYGELILKQNYIYIFEFKTSFVMNEDVARLENKSKEYVSLYNTNDTNDSKISIENNINSCNFTILYFYNSLENLGYRNFSGYNIDFNYWHFLYINPSCQILTVSKLSSKVMQLQKDHANLQKDHTNLKKEFEEERMKNTILFSQINKKWKDKYGEDCLKLDESQKEKYLQMEIENDFRDRIDSINDIKSFNSFEDLFKKFGEGMKNFLKVNKNDELKIDGNDEKWKKTLKENIKDEDYKLCFEILAPCIGASKASVNFKIIQKYLENKIKKNDEMSEIYNYIYSCLYGNREFDSSASFQTFYKGATKKGVALLQNIIKYTFYYDKKREGKPFYLLNLLKELVKNGNTEIHKTMIKLKNKSLFELVFMTIVLFNSDNSNFRPGFEYFPRK